jgi:hypothetical protein
MRFLVLTSRRIECRLSGYDLRVANLCAFLPGEVHLVVVPLRPLERDGVGLVPADVFDSVEELDPLVRERRHLRRHLRISNTQFIERTRPVAFARARARLAEIVRARRITHVVVFGGEAAELAATIDGPPMVLDVCDSASLTAERARASADHCSRALGRLHGVLDVARKRRTERHFARRFDLVTTINDADSRSVGGDRHREVQTVPNGLDEAYVRPLLPPGTGGVSRSGGTRRSGRTGTRCGSSSTRSTSPACAIAMSSCVSSASTRRPGSSHSPPTSH